jgi:hypothetical protein
MGRRRKKVCKRCKKKGLFNDSKQENCLSCMHEIAGDKKVFIPAIKKYVWEEI